MIPYITQPTRFLIIAHFFWGKFCKVPSFSNIPTSSLSNLQVSARAEKPKALIFSHPSNYCLASQRIWKILAFSTVKKIRLQSTWSIKRKMYQKTDWLQPQTEYRKTYGVFLWILVPNNHGVFPTKNDHHFGVWVLGVFPPLKTPIIWK